MAIEVNCPQCGHSMNLKAFLLGKRGICPKCQAAFDIPGSPASDSGASAPQARAAAPAAQPRQVTPGAGSKPSTPVARPSSVPARPASPHPATAKAASPQAAAPTAPRAAAPTPGAVPAQPTVPAQPVVPGQPVAAAPAGYTPRAAQAVPVPGAGYTSPAAPVQPAGYTQPGVVPVARPTATPVQPVAGQAVPVAQPRYTSGPVQPVGGPVTAPAVTAVPVASVPVASPVGVVDPLLEAPQAMWYVRPSSGGQFGPAGAELMRQWLEEGRVAADSLVWRDGWPDWKPAASCFPQFAEPSEPEPAVPGLDGIAVGPTGIGGRPVVYRRGSGGRLVAIGFLMIALLVLIPLLVWVLSRNM